jgi:hypothetical protein
MSKAILPTVKDKFHINMSCTCCSDLIPSRFFNIGPSRPGLQQQERLLTFAHVVNAFARCDFDF